MTDSTAADGTQLLQKFKYIYSTSLLLFCATIIFGLIFTEQTKLSRDAHPAAAFVILVLAIGWLTMVEGGQAAIVGLGPVNRDLYKESHKYAHMCTSLVHKGDNLDRYLLGRQFMVILIVFIIEMSAAAASNVDLWGFPKVVSNMFLVSGLSMILFTAMVGQLNAEINASRHMLDFLNNFVAIFTVWIALGIEFSGILHVCYLVQKGVGCVAGNPIEMKEAPRTPLQDVFFYGRCLMSTALLCFAFTLTLTALFNGYTNMWDFMPPSASVVVFFVLLAIVGLLEGAQIAYYAVSKRQRSERGDSYFQKKTCEIIFANNNQKLPSFMIGRQLCVVSCMFLIARITSVNLPEGVDNLYGVSDGVQGFFNAGLFGAFIAAVVGSVIWRLLGSAFPLAFLGNPLNYFLLRFCLCLEMTGALHGAWVLAAVVRRVTGFQRDEVYIGTAEERAAKNVEDNSDTLSVGPGHMVPDFEMEDVIMLDDDDRSRKSHGAKMAASEDNDLEMAAADVQHDTEESEGESHEGEDAKSPDTNPDQGQVARTPASLCDISGLSLSGFCG